jgi:hypothetical protein
MNTNHDLQWRKPAETPPIPGMYVGRLRDDSGKEILVWIEWNGKAFDGGGFSGLEILAWSSPPFNQTGWDSRTGSSRANQPVDDGHDGSEL